MKDRQLTQAILRSRESFSEQLVRATPLGLIQSPIATINHHK
ncbi:MAG: hypothetical protein ACD_28C00202G0002 [uncultured bacterium]|nr:MAG: hypothetical protein ACD_28C00202G0002 [uncultured bacterium]